MVFIEYCKGFQLSKLFKILIFATFIVTLFGSLKNSQAERIAYVYQNYRFVCDPADTLLTKKLVEKTKPALQILENFYGRGPRTIVTIQLTSSESSYHKYARNGVPEWSQAVAFPGQRLIVLRLASAEEVQQAVQTLTHELSHLFCAEIVPANRFPTWLNEGLAQFLSGKRLSLNDKMLLANALTLKRVKRLQALEGLHDFSPVKARLAYIQSLYAVDYFVRMHGRATLSKLVQNLGRFRSANRAWMQTVGYDALDFEIYWYEDLSRSYRWLVWLNLDNLIWLSMGLLALLAIWLVRRRNRLKLQRWEEEEDAEPKIEDEWENFKLS